MRRRERLLLSILLIFLAWMALQPMDAWVARHRLMYSYNRPTPITKIVEFRPTAITGVLAGAMLGSFRGVAANFLWLKMLRLWDMGQASELGHTGEAEDVMRTVTLLDPHWLEPWIFAGWHYAYNLSYEAEAVHNYLLQGELIDRGINYLMEGVSYNPGTYELYFELGWTYFDKLKAYDEAAKWARACLAFKHPEYIPRQIAHGYERIPDIPKALDWYDYCMKQNPADHTARGAILTIRERYLPSWRLMEQGKYDKALEWVQYYLNVDPKDRIGLHLKAMIQERQGDIQGALRTWKEAATLSINWYAERQVDRLSRKLGLPLGRETVYLPSGRAGLRRPSLAGGPLPLEGR
ncbi:MAG: tetratricopeptide repeat protein [Candidatus Zipacnadales bacterium]